MLGVAELGSGELHCRYRLERSRVGVTEVAREVLKPQREMIGSLLAKRANRANK